MTQISLHRADTRGHANHGWLDAHHSFSFADYYNPSRMGFGALRVLNDDIIAPGMGFGTHPHANMEIITIPLEGDLEHKDSMGNGTIIKNGDIQVMTAGSGIRHSEFNPNQDTRTNLLQIWVIPNTTGVEPRYDQMTLDPKNSHNQLEQIISPNKNSAGVWIHQDAWFHLGTFDAGKTIEYSFKNPKNGLYIFVISGSLEIENTSLETRDGMGIWDTNHISMNMLANSRVLLMEVPMK